MSHVPVIVGVNHTGDQANSTPPGPCSRRQAAADAVLVGPGANDRFEA